MKDCTMTEAPSIASRKQTSAEGQALEAYLQDVSVYSQTNQLSGFIDSGNHFINGVTSLSQDIETPNRDQALSPKSESLYAPNLCEISYEKLHQPQFGMISPSKIKKNINKFVQTNRNCTMSFEVPHNKFTESSHRNSSQLIPTEKQTKPIRGQQLLLLSQGEDSGNDQKTGNIPTFQSNAFTTTRCSSGGPLDVRSDTLMFHHHHPKKKLMKQVADVSIFRTPVQSIECPCPSPPVRNGVETTRNQLSKQLYKIRTELPSTGFAAQSNRSMAPSSLGDIIPMSYNTTNESFPHIYSRHSPTAKTDFFVAGKADKLSLVEGRRRKSFGSAFYPQPIELCTNGSSVSGAAARLSEHASDGEEQNDKVSESYEKMVPQKKREKRSVTIHNLVEFLICNDQYRSSLYEYPSITEDNGIGESSIAEGECELDLSDMAETEEESEDDKDDEEGDYDKEIVDDEKAGEEEEEQAEDIEAKGEELDWAEEDSESEGENNKDNRVQGQFKYFRDNNDAESDEVEAYDDDDNDEVENIYPCEEGCEEDDYNEEEDDVDEAKSEEEMEAIEEYMSEEVEEKITCSKHGLYENSTDPTVSGTATLQLDPVLSSVTRKDSRAKPTLQQPAHWDNAYKLNTGSQKNRQAQPYSKELSVHNKNNPAYQNLRQSQNQRHIKSQQSVDLISPGTMMHLPVVHDKNMRLLHPSLQPYSLDLPHFGAVQDQLAALTLPAGNRVTMATRSNLYFSPEIDLSAMTEEVNRYSGSVKRDYGGPSRQGILRGRPSNRSAEIVQRLQANDNEIKRSGTSRNQEKESCF